MSKGPRLPAEHAQVAWDVVESIINIAFGHRAAHLAGSLRRGRDEVGDVDVVVVTREEDDPLDIIDALGADPRMNYVRGKKKVQFWTYTWKHTGDGIAIPVDLNFVAPHQLGTAMLASTGPVGLNIELRRRAKKRGFTLNQYALIDQTSGDHMTLPSGAPLQEQDVFELLGMSYLSPEQREEKFNE